jgi:peroxiredoxin
MKLMLALLLSLTSIDAASKLQPRPVCLKNQSVDLKLQFTAPDGGRLSLQGYAGRRLVLSFWATWARASRSQLLTLDGASAAWEKKSVDVLAVALKPESLQSVIAIQQKNKLTINVAAAMDDSEVTKAFQITAVPSTYIIDEGGTIAQCFAGVVSAAELEKHLGVK